MKTPEQLAAIRAAECDPVRDAEGLARAAAAAARIDHAKQQRLVAQAKRAPHDRAKVILLRELADNLGAAMDGVAPCRKGCNHCCHIPLQLTPNEAAIIARETGARLAKPALSLYPDMTYTGTPCPFLTPQGCGIYAHRPYACRVYYVLDRDNLLCEWVPEAMPPIRSRQFDSLAYNRALAEAFGRFDTMKFADIRAFFPKGLK